MEKQVFVDFATRILSLEEDKKEIGVEIKEAKAAFAENNNIEVDSITEAIAAYKKYLKDSAKFALVDRELSQILNDCIYVDLIDK